MSKDTDNKNYGMVTKIWGPPGWLFLHTVTMGYPYEIDPNNEQHQTKKREMRKFFESLGHVLPCELCCDSFKKFIQEEDTLLTDEVLSSRINLAKWFYDMHNKVNKKLNVCPDTIPTFQEFYDRYEMYRAECSRNKKMLGCTKSKDSIPKHSKIQIVDKHGNNYTIQTTNITDQKILDNFYKTNDCTQLHLISESTKQLLRNKAIYCIQNKVGNTIRAQCIIDNL